MYNDHWNRKKIVDFVNEEISRKIHIGVAWTYNIRETIEAVGKFRRENGYPKEMMAKVDDGFLFINNLPVGRIAAKLPRPAFDERSYYIEQKILAMQESYYD